MPNQTSLGYPYGADFAPRGNRRDTRHIVCHHNVSRNNLPEQPQAENIVNFHMRPQIEGGRGWRSGGYNSVIEQDGSFVPLLSELAKGAHAGALNSVAYGVCIIGDGRAAGFFNEAQQITLKRLIRDLLTRYPQAEVVGHRDIAEAAGTPTVCPAYDFGAWWALARKAARKIIHRSETFTIDVAEPGKLMITIDIATEE